MGATSDQVVSRDDMRRKGVGTLASQQSKESRLALIVDDLHVTYKVIGSSIPDPNAKPSILDRVHFVRGRSSTVTEIEAVRGVSFSASHGDSIGILGINGSGKSTLLRAIAGLLPPSKGRVWVSSEPALLGVNAALMPTLSGERNIMLGGLALGLNREEIRDRTQDVAEFAELGDFLHLPMQSYSSGMAARLRFAISTMRIPDILMIDEALVTGDSSFQKKSLERISQIRKNAGTIFFVSHDLNTVREICSRAIWLDQGELMMDGAVKEVSDAYEAFSTHRSHGTVGARLFADARQPPNAPNVIVPERVPRSGELSIRWEPDGGFQRRAEVAVAFQNEVWIPTNGAVPDSTSSISLNALQNPQIFANPYVQVTVRTWGLATKGGEDDSGGSAWSEPQTVYFDQDV